MAAVLELFFGSLILAFGILLLIRPGWFGWLYDGYRRNAGWLKVSEAQYDRNRRITAKVAPYFFLLVGTVLTAEGLVDLLS